MRSSWPVDIVALNPVACGSVLWRTGGVLRVTVVVKATFTFGADGDVALSAPEPVQREDRYEDDDPSRSLRSASELAPYLPGAGVVLTGHAHAPPTGPVAALPARLAVFRDTLLLDKTIHVFGDPAPGSDTPGPFQRMPLVYERAQGGPSSPWNPVGVADASAGERADQGERASLPGDKRPNLVHPVNPHRPAGFGPIAPHWPLRKRLFGGLDARAATPSAQLGSPGAAPAGAPGAAPPSQLGSHGAAPAGAPGAAPAGVHGVAPAGATETEVLDIPEDFDFRAFNPAPFDQQIAFLQGDEWIVLDHLNAQRARVEVRLPSARARVRRYRVHGAGVGGFQEIPLSADLLILDADRQLASLVWRGNFAIERPEVLKDIRLFAGVETQTMSIVWPQPGDTAPSAHARSGPDTAARSASAALSSSVLSIFWEDVPPQSSAQATPPPRRHAPSPELVETAPLRKVDTPVLPFRDAPASFHDAPASFRDVPPAPCDSSAGFRDSSASFRDVPAASRDSSAGFRDSSAGFRDSSASFRDVPAASRDSSAGFRDSSAGFRDSSAGFRDAPAAFRDAPAASQAQPDLAVRGETGPLDQRMPIPEDQLAQVGAERAQFPLAAPGTSSPREEPPIPGAPWSPVPAPPLIRPADLGGFQQPRTLVDGHRAERAAVASATVAPPAEVAPLAAATQPVEVAPLVAATQPAAVAPLVAATQPAKVAPLAAATQPAEVALPAEVAPLAAAVPPAEVAPLATAVPPAEVVPAAASSPLAGIEVRKRAEAKLARGCDLDGDDLSGGDLSGLDFSGRSLVRCSLRGANLRGARLAGATLAEATLEGADLRGADLSRAILAKARADRAELTEAVLEEADLRGASLRGAVLERARLARALGEGAMLTSANLSGADLEEARFMGASLVDANLREARADLVDFAFARLDRADLGGASLRKARLVSAVLAHARLDLTDLRGADLERANVHGAARRRAKIAGANMKDLDETAPASPDEPERA